MTVLETNLLSILSKRVWIHGSSKRMEGVAFNSTFVALVLSIVIMFCLHQLQLSQERLVLDCQRQSDKRLLRYLVAH